MFKQVKKVISIVILAAFISTSVKSPAYAQLASVDQMPFMPKPGVMVHLSPEYTPAYLKGIVIHPENALKFDFIIYKGDKVLTDAQKREEYTKLTKYFLASLAIPDDDQWVNLSPYEKDRIIKDDFGKTEMGRDLLAQDYMLKQITASLIYPEDNLGKKFWDRVYAQAQEQFGTTNIPVNTFNKVWILPDDALIYEKGNTAYVLKNHLRVMLEEDYLSLEKHSGIMASKNQRQPGDMASAVSPSPLPSDAGLNAKAPQVNNRSTNEITNALASRIVRQIVLPELEREVNEGENFAPLRQVYSGMLLAAWYKRALKESLLSKIYANKAKVKGVDQDPKTNEVIYRQYLRAYKKGVFNFIKEDVDKYTHETIPRKYFSGGMGNYALGARLGHPIKIENSLTSDQDAAMAGEFRTNRYDIALVDAREAANPAMSTDAAMNIDPKNSYNGANLSPTQQKIKNLFDVARQNTEVPAIMVVCVGNIFRSKVMELVLKHLSKKYGIKIEVQSAGTLPWGSSIIRNNVSKIFDRVVKQFIIKQPNDETKIKAKRIEELFKIIGTGSATTKLTRDVLIAGLLRFDENDVSNIWGIKEEEIKALSDISGKVVAQLGQLLPLYPKKSVIDAAKKYGIEPDFVNESKGPQFLTRDNTKQATIILVADGSNLEFIKEYFPQATGKTFLGKALERQTAMFDPDLPDPQKREISEIELFKLVGNLFEQHLIPLLLNPSAAQSQVIPIFSKQPPTTRMPALVDPRPLSPHVNISWADGKARIQVKPLTGEPETLWLFEVYLDNVKIDFFINGHLKDGLPIKPGKFLDFGWKVKRIGKEREYVIQSEGQLFSIGRAITTQGTIVPAFIDLRPKQVGTLSKLGKLSSFLNEKVIPSRRLSNIGGGRLDVVNFTDTSDIVVKLGDNLLEKFGGHRHAVLHFVLEEGASDKASIANIVKPESAPGGIDLNAANLNLQIKRDGNGVPLPISQQNLDNIHLEGLIPVILGIKPAMETPLLSELQTSQTP